MGDLLCVLVLLFQLAFLLRLVLSFFPLVSGSTFAAVRDVSIAITDPVVWPIRRKVPPLPGAMAGFGVAEILVLILIQIIASIVCR
jgi:uncharacterized protein YggT (Ycf19 family)